MDTKRTLLLFSSAATLASFLTSPAAAQTGGGQEQRAQDSTALEEVIVTARGRREIQRDVPITIQSFTGDQLEEIGVNSVEDVLKLVPGVELAQATGQPMGSDIIIRGAGTGRFINTDPALGLYVNGAFVLGGNLGGRTFNDSDLFDAQRLEVLKGPQGALYGRNALGGAINIIHRRPALDGSRNAEVSLTTNEYNLRAAGLRGDMTLIPDVLAVRVAGEIADQDEGYIYNPFLDNYTDRRTSRIGRIVALYQPLDTVTATLQYDYYRMKGIGALSYQNTVVDDPYNWSRDDDARASQKQQNFLGTIRWEINPDVTLDVIANHRKREGAILEDFDQGVASNPFNAADQLACFSVMSGMPAVTTFPPNQRCQLLSDDDFDRSSLEVRLVGRTDNMRWILGADYQDAQGVFNNRQNNRAQNAFALRSENSANGYSIYGSLERDLTSRLLVGAEARYTDEDKTSSSRNIRTEAPSIIGSVIYDNLLTTQTTEPTGTFFGRFKLLENTALFFRAGNGFRSGGLNLDSRDLVNPITNLVANVPDTYGAEKAISYEASVRTSFFERRLSIDFSVFRTNFSDILLNVNNGLTAPNLVMYVDNLGDAELQGSELTVEFRDEFLGGQLSGFVSGTSIDSELTSGPRIGIEITRVPDWSVSSLVQYSRPIVRDLRAFGSVRYRRQEGGISNLTTLAPLQEPQLWDLTLGISGPDWRLQGTVSNLTDENEPLNETAGGILVPRAPQSWTLTFVKTFD